MLKRYTKINKLYYEDSNGEYIFKNNKPILITKAILFKDYQKQVHKLTKETSKALEHISLIGFNTYHIDHKISIYYGFNNNIKASHIADISNLRVIPAIENIAKNKGVLIDELNNWILNDFIGVHSVEKVD
jgi:hypothetical protein